MPAAPAKSKIGRPAATLPDAVLKRLGRPPEDALGRIRWAGALLAEAAWLRLTGELSRELSQEIRAWCGAISRSVPLDVLAEADARMRTELGEIERDPSREPEKETIFDLSRSAIRRDPS